MVRNIIPRVCFSFCSTERNSELFFLPLKSSEGNFKSLLLVWYHGTEFWVVFSSAEGFGRKFWEFACIFVQRNGIPNCFLFRGRVRNGIPRVSVPRNSRNSVRNNHLFRLFRLPLNYFFVGNSQPYARRLWTPAFLVRGEDTLAGWRGGQYFGRRPTQLCTLRISVLCGTDLLEITFPPLILSNSMQIKGILYFYQVSRHRCIFS
jgi:hypothetical protein